MGQSVIMVKQTIFTWSSLQLNNFKIALGELLLCIEWNAKMYEERDSFLPDEFFNLIHEVCDASVAWGVGGRGRCQNPLWVITVMLQNP